ncbi:lipoyl(octanoyl) transferase LipB [Verrucomicrobiales bacterium]|jgi:lipoyl(octanoyl) transferase|nr:lipoyl(octanoyl) transferase LipB [Verrucomicrobiales bacterium]
MDFRWLGRVNYSDGLDLQNELVEQRQKGEIEDTVLLLEHEPVYTIGRTRDQFSLNLEKALPHPVFEVNRGGQATYHGPGQLVGYLILDLVPYGKDLHTYLRELESILIDFTSEFGINAQRREGLTGVWAETRKLASIGVGVRKWVSMHGFGLNISSDLSGYESIIPCGISDVSMTSISSEIDREVTVKEAADSIEPLIREHLTAFKDHL